MNQTAANRTSDIHARLSKHSDAITAPARSVSAFLAECDAQKAKREKLLAQCDAEQRNPHTGETNEEKEQRISQAFGMKYEPTEILKTALELAQAWSDTITQHNLLSTATAEERNAFIQRNIDAYNRVACPILEANTPEAIAARTAENDRRHNNREG